MESRSNKELAIETALEYTKSWNAAAHTTPIKSQEFINLLNSIYSAICALDTSK